jgi:SNF2 family DNA or RNA helicase
VDTDFSRSTRHTPLKIELSTPAASLKDTNRRLKYNYKTPPFSHQKKALKKLLQLDGKGALFMEMGTGKTKVAIDWAGINFYNAGLRRVLVVAPLSVLGVWSRQVHQHSGAPARVVRLEGSTRDKLIVLRKELRRPRRDELVYVVVNYESIWREPDRGRSIEDLLIAWSPGLIIFDESHRIKSPTSKQSKSAHRIARTVDQRILLSGTPISKAPLDVFGQFRAMNDEIFGDNWYRFKNTYGVWGGFGRFQLRGYRHLSRLITKVRENSYRIKKAQCLDLPDKLYQTVPVTLSDRELKAYKDMADEMIAEVEDTQAVASIVLVKYLRLSQITSGFVKDVEGRLVTLGESKLRTAMDLLDDILEDGHKVVIFSRFIEDMRRQSAHLTKAKVQHRILSGSVTGSRRDSIIEEFQTDPEVKVFLAQLQAGSEGIELFAADTVFFYSVGHNALHYWQAQDRVHRPGQKNNVTYYKFEAPRTYDVSLFKTLDLKGNMAEAIIHNPRGAAYGEI